MNNKSIFLSLMAIFFMLGCGGPHSDSEELSEEATSPLEEREEDIKPPQPVATPEKKTEEKKKPEKFPPGVFVKIYDSGDGLIPLTTGSKQYLIPKVGDYLGNMHYVKIPGAGLIKISVKILEKGKKIQASFASSVKFIEIGGDPEKDVQEKTLEVIKSNEEIAFFSPLGKRNVNISNLVIEFKKTEAIEKSP